MTSNGSDDGYVAKFDSEGALLFAKNIGGSDYDYSLDIATDSNGDAWVLGVSRATSTSTETAPMI
ncbi:MAG: hypothetical protein GDA56_22280 [Hormoscilla sp. GM7CHS1pb]|nr:hypothetical protein [Hormoscilla sp. GM7CHS1pb]